MEWMKYFSNHIILILILLSGCHSKPSKQKIRSATKFPAVRFSLDGHHFQIGMLTLPGILSDYVPPTTEAEELAEYEESTEAEEITDAEEFEEPTEAYVDETADDETQTITQFAMLRMIPKTPAPVQPKISGGFDKIVKTLKKMKSRYRELGQMLEAHEKELLFLLKNSARRKETKKSHIDDTSIHVKINGDGDTHNFVEEQAHTEQLISSGRKGDDTNSLNIRVHAEPPLKMRTIIGYPQKSQKNVLPLKKSLANIRIYPRERPYPSTVLASPYESSAEGILDQDISSDEKAFLRRGSELLLNMWKRFQSHKAQSKIEEQEPPYFNENAVQNEK